MKKKLFNIGATLAFWAKDSLFLFFFIFTSPVFANSISVRPFDTEDLPLTSENDSISNLSAPLENVKIYVSSGTIIYNAEKISKNVEIIQKESQIKKNVVKPNNFTHSKKTLESKVPKAKKKEYKYASDIQFRKLPFESNNIFSKSGRDVITVPCTNPQYKILALLEFYQTSLLISTKEKCISKYGLNFSGNIYYRHMHIRPPPAI